MDIMYLIAAAAQQQATLSDTPSGGGPLTLLDTTADYTGDWSSAYVEDDSSFYGYDTGGGVWYYDFYAEGYPDGEEGSFATDSTIDLTGYDTITVTYSENGDESTVWLVVDTDDRDTDHETYDARTSASTSDGEIILDISALSGTHYIRIHLVVAPYDIGDILLDSIILE